MVRAGGGDEPHCLEQDADDEGPLQAAGYRLSASAHLTALERTVMTESMKNVPSKRPVTETPTVIDSTTDAAEQKHKKMERMADRAAHKANKTEQEFDQNHNTFSNIGPH